MRRELAKAERRRRLKDAALAVFAEKGFEAATTREIAEVAGVGAATLFRYAQEKRDLLLMIVNDDLSAMNDEVFPKAAAPMPLIEALMTLFGPRYTYFGKNPQLAREALHVTVLARADHDTFETQRYVHRRGKLLETMIGIIRENQARGHVRRDHDAGVLADFFMDVYVAQRRRWLSNPKPNVRAGTTALRQTFQLAIEGMRGSAAGHEPSVDERPVSR